MTPPPHLPPSRFRVKMFLKTKGRKENKYIKIVLLAKSKLNSIKKIISKALIDFDISNDEFTVVINEEQSYFKL